MRMSGSRGAATMEGREEGEHCREGSTPVCRVEMGPRDIDAALAMGRLEKVADPLEKAGSAPGGRAEKEAAGIARVTLEDWMAALGTTTVGKEGRLEMGRGAGLGATEVAMVTVGREAMGIVWSVVPGRGVKEGVQREEGEVVDVVDRLPSAVVDRLPSADTEELATGLIVIDSVDVSWSIGCTCEYQPHTN